MPEDSHVKLLLDQLGFSTKPSAWSDPIMPFCEFSPFSRNLCLIPLQWIKFGTSLFTFFFGEVHFMWALDRSKGSKSCASPLSESPCLLGLLGTLDTLYICLLGPGPCIFVLYYMPKHVWDEYPRKQEKWKDGGDWKKSWLSDLVLLIWLLTNKMHQNRTSREVSWKKFQDGNSDINATTILIGLGWLGSLPQDLPILWFFFILIPRP